MNRVEVKDVRKTCVLKADCLDKHGDVSVNSLLLKFDFGVG